MTPTNAYLYVISNRLAAPFEMTRSRVIYALSNLGVFDHVRAANEPWYEFDFDIVISDASLTPELRNWTVIGRGSVGQSAEGLVTDS